MSLKTMEVYEYKCFVIFFNRSTNCFKNSVNAMSAPEAEALIATGSSARCSLCDAFDVKRVTKRGNLQRRAQADKQQADV